MVPSTLPSQSQELGKYHQGTSLGGKQCEVMQATLYDVDNLTESCQDQDTSQEDLGNQVSSEHLFVFN